MRYVCTDCGCGFDHEPLVYNGSVFCREMCLRHFQNAEAQRQAEANAKAYAKLNVEQTSSQTAGSNSGSNGVNSAAGAAMAGAGSAAGAAMAGAGIGMAAAGAGAALAGVGAAAKGLGALTKGAGSLLGGLGKGAGVMADAMKSGLDGTKAEFGKTRSAEQEIIAINKMTFSSDPEEYKKEIWALFDKATSKPADPLRDTFIIKAAKKKLIHELDMCKLKNPEMFSQFAQLYEELNKKKKLFGLFG